MKDVLKNKEGYKDISKTVKYVVNNEEINSLEYEILENNITKENIKILMDKFNNNPDSLDLDEIILIRKICFKKRKEFVNLEYSKGFYMVSNDIREILSGLDYTTRGVLQEIGFMVNAEGTLRYRNHKPIRTFTDLQIEAKVSEGVWRKVKPIFDKLEIIKREKINDEWYLVLNPLYQSNSYKITYFKFLCFGKLLKEKLDKIDYLYLCKLFEIVPA